MLSIVPKQFLCLDGIPILIRSIEVFRKYDKNINVIVVLPEEQKNYWKDLCKKHKFIDNHILVSGGETRFQSVKNGLAYVKEEDSLIAVHDGVRPLISAGIIDKVFQCTKENGNAIPCIKLNDSLRITEKDSSKPIDRNRIFAIQTPQCFTGKILKQAYEQNFEEQFTDDATVVEKLGYRIFLTEGSSENIKITTQTDLLFAEAILKSKK